jgi:hypothetical protein
VPRNPLFRKVNTRARGVFHHFGSRAAYERNTKKEERSEALRGTMHGKHRRGLDYTPLFKFLLSKVGSKWDDVFSEAVARLDRPEPIFWLVALHEHQREDLVLVGESSYYSGLYVDTDGRLRVVNPDLGPEDVIPSCTCCTYTFNGVPIPRPD